MRLGHLMVEKDRRRNIWNGWVFFWRFSADSMGVQRHCTQRKNNRSKVLLLITNKGQCMNLLWIFRVQQIQWTCQHKTFWLLQSFWWFLISHRNKKSCCQCSFQNFLSFTCKSSILLTSHVGIWVELSFFACVSYFYDK